MELRSKPWVNKVFNKIVLIAIAATVIFMTALFFKSDLGSGINKDGYQLVNLTTGERYIGKLSGLSGKYVVLDDVYQQQDAGAADAKDTSAQTQITVAKLSSSVIKPENKMRIASDKIVHWENLQDDGKVVQAIKQDGTK